MKLKPQRIVDWLLVITIVHAASACAAVTPVVSTRAREPASSRPPPTFGDAASAPPTVRVHLDADDRRAGLFKLRGVGQALSYDADGNAMVVATEDLESVCAAPCDVDLSARDTYRVAGAGITPSDPLLLPIDRSTANLRARTGSLRGRRIGALVTVLGGGQIAAGLGLLIAGALIPAPNFSGAPPSFVASAQADYNQRHDAFLTAGGVIVGTGVASMVAGLIVFARNRTAVSIDDPRFASLRAGAFEVTPTGVHF